MKISIEISPGELIDRLSILLIKLSKINDKAKLNNVYNEYIMTSDIFFSLVNDYSDSDTLYDYLIKMMSINVKIWNLEEDIRNTTGLGEDYYLKIGTIGSKIADSNDDRASLKKEINILLGSTLVEEKSH